NGVPDNCECLGDVSLDGSVDGIDLGLLLAAWGAVTPSGASQRSDIARDGNVDGVDLGQLLSRWGVCGN
ncbi:MAG: dockerin type I domain-containing protein, partial [Phycisphaerales bacterium]